MAILPLVHFLTLSVVLGAAVVMDIRERRIPNKITASGFLCGVILGVFMEGIPPVSALAGAGVGLAVSLPAVAVGGLGAGDAKLFAAVGSFFGPGGLLSVFLYGAIAGGVLALVSTVREGTLAGVLLNLKELFIYFLSFGKRGSRISLDNPEAKTIPYGVAIAVGAWGAWFLPISLGGSQ